MNLIQWFVKNPIAANILNLIILVLGVIGIFEVKKSILPDIERQTVSVSAYYPGASPKEVASAVVAPIEAALTDVDAIERMQAFAYPNAAYLSLTIKSDYDKNWAKDQIQKRLNALNNLPKLVEIPKAEVLDIQSEMAATLVVSGPADQDTLKQIAEKIREELREKHGISTTRLSSIKPTEIQIEVSSRALQRYDLTFDDLSLAIQSQSLSLAAGSIRSRSGEITVVASDVVRSKSELENVVIRSNPDGGRLLLGDVAQIKNTLRNQSALSEFDGYPAVFIEVFRSGEQNLLDLSKSLHAYVAAPKAFLGQQMRLTLTKDFASYYQSRLHLLLENGLQGFVLVFAILWMTLRLKLAFWVALGIPVSFAAALFFMPILGVSLNMVTLFTFILLLGMVEDDAIAVGENVDRYLKQGYSGPESAMLGANEIKWPVMVSSLITALMFLPMLFLPGAEGGLVKEIPIVVILVLAASLIESFFILPAHLAYHKQLIPDGLENGYERFARKYIAPLISKCLEWRYGIFVLFTGVLFLSFSLVLSGWVKLVFNSNIESDVIYANVQLPNGSSELETQQVLARLLAAAKQLQINDKGVKHISQFNGNAFAQSAIAPGANVGSMVLELVDPEFRNLSARNLTDEWRVLTGKLPDSVQVSFESSLNQSGPSIDFRLVSDDLDVLYQASLLLKQRIARYEGVYGVQDSFRLGRQEANLVLKPLASQLGIQLSDLAAQVRHSFYGVELKGIQLQEEGKASVFLRYPEEERSSLWYLENLPVRLPSGEFVPLSVVASIEYQQEPGFITRTDRKTEVRLKAYVNEKNANSEEVVRAIKQNELPQILKQFPTISWQTSGARQSQEEFESQLTRNVLLILLAIFFVLAIMFRSYLQPWILMISIPFSISGAIWGHFLLGYDLTLWSLIGMVAVGGAVCNDNLVLIDRINRHRSDFESIKFTIIESVVVRFRTIWVTSMTTFIGLAPMLLEESLQAQFLIPMAISVGFGVLYEAVLTIIFVPACYLIFEDIHGTQLKARKKFR
jgi:multidrug efflux pump subunit AcrB